LAKREGLVLTTRNAFTQDIRPAGDARQSATSPSSEAVRRYDLDWLRIFAFGVLIFYHVGLFYTTSDWYLKSRYTSSFIEPIMGLASGRLALLFFISGVAVRFAMDKQTLRRFLPDRITRLVLPLAFGMAVVCAPQTYVELRYLGEIDPGYLSFYRDYLGFGDFTLVRPPWNHLWYVAYILVFTLVAAACLPLLRWATTALASPFFAWLANGRSWRVLVVPAIPFAMYTLLLDPYFPTTLALWGDWAYIVRTFSFFLFGFLAAKNADFWNTVDRVLPAAVAFTAMLGGLLLTAYLNEFAVTSDAVLLKGFLLLRVFYAWSLIVTLFGLARRFANRPSATLTYLTAAIFPYYILHQTITLGISYWFTVNEAPLLVEATTIILVTVLGCVLGYEAIRRVPALRPFFGLPAHKNSR